MENKKLLVGDILTGSECQELKKIIGHSVVDWDTYRDRFAVEIKKCQDDADYLQKIQCKINDIIYSDQVKRLGRQND